MKITEALLDQILEGLSKDDGQSLEAHLYRLSEEQPLIVDYLNQESFDLLTHEERDILLFLSIVLWEAFKQNGLEEQIPASLIEQTEEENWLLMNEAGGRSFREKLDVFFKVYDEEEILALIEDTLTPDEVDPFITDEGRMFVFVALKTIADAFLARL